mmetsp:Transcript_8224/g.24648  ORF Transcript_8224/g.24648 Transcript_8224/m.24648 type:complete len:189 (-) Transcript_8224:23-589(-)
MSDVGRFRVDGGADDALARHGASVAMTLALREPLRTPFVRKVADRVEVKIDEATWPEPPRGAAKIAAAVAEKPPPAEEVKNPHASSLFVSDSVLDAAIANLDSGSAKIEVVAQRLALVTAQQLLQAEVERGALTPRAYMARVADRRDADKRLARHLAALGRKADATAVLRRAEVATAELKEMEEAGVG